MLITHHWLAFGDMIHTFLLSSKSANLFDLGEKRNYKVVQKEVMLRLGWGVRNIFFKKKERKKRHQHNLWFCCDRNAEVYSSLSGGYSFGE